MMEDSDFRQVARSEGSTRAPIRRARTGCFTCRRRRKKCDEGKPECLGCQKSGYLCEGYPETTRFRENRTKEQRQDGVFSPRSTQFTNDVATYPHSQYGYEDIWSPCFPDSSKGIVEWFLQDGSFHCLTEPGILDSPFDTGGACETRDTAPALPVRTTGSLARVATSPSMTNTSPGIPRTLPFLVNGIENRTEQRFFAHFTSVTSRVLTISNDANNPLLTTILPLSLQDRMIQKAILCLGASHLLLLLPEPEPGLVEEKERLLKGAENDQMGRAASLKTLALQGCKGELDAILSCTLLLCLFEISEGSGDIAWRVRLDIARDLIQAAMEVGPALKTRNTNDKTNHSPEIDKFLLEFFIYHDILATVTDCSRMPVLSNAPLHTAYMLGVDNGLFDLVARVAALRSVESAGVRLCEALVLWEDMNTWQISSADHDQALACSAYICALFVWLYSIIYPDNVADAKVRDTVRRGMNDMTQIQGSGVLAFLLFPTFILGFASVERDEREACSAQFARLRIFSGLGNVKLAENVVRTSWEEYDTQHPSDWSWDWVQQMEKHGVSLPLT